MRPEPASYPGHCEGKNTFRCYFNPWFFNSPVCLFDLFVWLRNFVRTLQQPHIWVERYMVTCFTLTKVIPKNTVTL